MAGRLRGEIRVAAEGRDWTLRLDFNALCAFEEATGLDALDTLAAFERGEVKVRVLRQFFHACLQHHHPEATLQDAGLVVSESPEALNRLMTAALPDAPAAEAAPAGGGAGNVAPPA